MIKFRVIGEPATQGSKQGYAVKRGGHYTGRVAMVDDNKAALRTWRQAVIDEVWAADWGTSWTGLGPVSVSITFLLARPMSHYGTGANRARLRPGAPRRPGGRPDLDKLARGVLDALTVARVWADDGQVADLTLAKHYTASPGEPPGAVVEIVSAQ